MQPQKKYTTSGRVPHKPHQTNKMVRIRLARRGRKKLAIYDIIVADSRAPRDGRFIEKLGMYNPNTVPATMVFNEEKSLKWLLDGAQPSPTVKAILSYRGILYKKHLQIGVIKKAITQEKADEKFALWKAQKDSKITQRVTNLADAKTAARNARLETETQVREARAEAIRKKNEVKVEPVVTEEVTSETTETTTTETAE